MKALLFIVMFIPALSFADHIQVKVQGMVCSMCAQGIQKKFKADQAVSRVDVNLDEKTVHLETKAKNDLTDDQIKKIITEAGYSVKEIVRK